ncbi:MAG TPA: hypothetical protein VEC37_17265, partial [Bacillota bacterium]|nr:hypothetical protein [Bacillota bacterium]
MSLPIPNLDDRNFETLIDEARSLIPVYSREWTNHNYSDPGIMLLELFAWLTESTLYRLNQIPEATYRRYLKLLGTEQLFTWEALPGEDNGRLLEFLAKNYGLDWIKSAWIRRNGDGEIVVTDGTQTVSLKLDQANAQINLSIENGPRDELIVKRVQTQLFNWQRIPGVDTYRLYQFLQQFYAVDWTRSARLEKSSDRKSLWLSNESDTVRLQLDATGKQVDIVFNVGNTFSVPFQTESEEVFKWERIPGKDTPKLQQFLTQYYGIHWENGASLVKEADGETIIVQNGNDRFCLIRDEAESRIQIIFDNQGFQPVTVQFPDNHLLFCWTHVPGKAERRIIRFLRKYYGVPWVTNAAVIKSPDGHSVTITDQEHRINLIKNRSSGSNSLQLNAGTQYQFELKQEKNYLFNWDNIPGSDNRRLLEYLYKNYAAADWVRTASIERGDTDTIIISQDHHRLTIRRNSPDEIRLTFEPGIPYQFSIKRKLEGFFNWERFDIIDQTKVRQFLWQNYGLEWVKEAAFVKDTSRNLITLQAEAGKILLRPEDDGDLVVISFFAGNAFTFQLQAEPVMQRVYQSIEKDLLRGVQRLSRPYRAVTISDYEVLAKECLEWLKPGLAAASRVICIPNRDWEYGQSGIEKPGHLTVILIPGLDTPELEWEQVTGPDQGKFRELLWIIYRLEWIKTARIQKNSRGNLVMVFGEQTAQTIFGIMDVTGERVKMVLGLEPKVLRIVTDGEKRMAVDEDNNHSKPWFCWEDLPGTDNPQLIDYLRRSLGAAWA